LVLRRVSTVVDAGLMGRGEAAEPGLSDGLAAAFVFVVGVT